MDNLINAIDKIVEGQVFKIVISNKKDKENKYNKIDVYKRQHKDRPNTRFYIEYVFDEFVELHGDRNFRDEDVYKRQIT